MRTALAALLTTLALLTAGCSSDPADVAGLAQVLDCTDVEIDADTVATNEAVCTLPTGTRVTLVEYATPGQADALADLSESFGLTVEPVTDTLALIGDAANVKEATALLD